MKKNIFLVSILFSQLFILTACNQGGSSTSDGDSENTSAERVKIHLTWTPPTERKDQSRLYPYEIGGYEIIYRQVGHHQWNSIVVYDDQSWVLEEYEITDLEPGTYELAMATFDIDGLFSDYSETVTVTK